jgi:carbonic anhydrase/acetyltransferase-like protein (isoleucine patch superfamily)
MAIITSSVTVIAGRLANADALDARVQALRQRFPRAVIDRYLDLVPDIGEGALVAPGASIVANVRLGKDVSFWYGCVARGDLAPVTVGDRSNIQDGTVMHVGDDSPCVVGCDVVVGHRVMLHACRVEDACLIGMQATLLDDCVIGEGSIVGAGALVTQRTVIPPYSLVLASVADDHRALAGKYMRIKENYLRGS